MKKRMELDGSITISGKIEDYFKLYEKMRDAFRCDVDISIYHGGTATFYLDGKTDFSIDRIYAFLEDITPYTIDGTIRYVDGSGVYNRQFFDKKEERWYEMRNCAEHYENKGPITRLTEREKRIREEDRCLQQAGGTGPGKPKTKYGA